MKIRRKVGMVLLGHLLMLLVCGLTKERPGNYPSAGLYRDALSPEIYFPPKPWPANMMWVPGGEFVMGSDDADASLNERPAHKVRLSGYWMDMTEVTNAQFEKFVRETGYKTVAERRPAWAELKSEGTSMSDEISDDFLAPGSFVFMPPLTPVLAYDNSWWVWTIGASWRNPRGAAIDRGVVPNHPVVHIAYEDAVSYCEWAGKRLPTEAEWEFASLGGNKGLRYSWGDEFNPFGHFMANTFQGSFPILDTGDDGHTGLAPVKSYFPNGYGLFDMTGNVWEWTSDLYNTQYYNELAKAGVAFNPQGPDKCYDPDDVYATKYVTRGGSFLCSNSYCSSFKPSSRQGSLFDSGMSNIGFRCVMSDETWRKIQVRNIEKP
jgi:formylglycine-generating enzyme required for sulfatase activity